MKIFYKRKQMIGFALSAAIVSNSLVVGNATGVETSEVNEENIEKGNEVIENQIEVNEEIGLMSMQRAIGDTYKVVVDSLNVRSGPSTSNSVLGGLKKGTIIEVQSISNGWAKFNFNGKVAYCNASTSYLQKVTSSSTSTNSAASQTGTTTTSTSKVTADVNLRSTNSWSGTKLMVIKKGSTVDYISKHNEWTKVKYDGKTGYVPTEYVKVGSSSATGSTNTTTGTTATGSKASITVDVNLRSTNSWSGTKLMVIKKGSTVDYISKHNEWTKVKYDGKTGYVPTEYVKVIAGSTSSTPSTSTEEKNMVTVKDATWLRKTASWSAEKAVLVQKGEKAEYISRTADWIKVKYNGTVGYLTADYVMNVPEVQENETTELKKYKVTTDVLNVRKGPGTNYEKVGSVKKGEIIEVYSITSGWAKFKFGATTGYVSADYITAYNENESTNSGVGKKVYLDPGHGGADAGAVGRTYGTKEKDMALDVTKRVASKLRDKGYVVSESRTTDVYPSLTQRSNDANAKKTDIFVSMHFNSATSTSATGLETLYKVDGRTSNVLADKIQDELIDSTGLRDRGLKQRSDLSVLNRTTMPAVLVEGGFLSNSTEENLIRSASYRETLANAIVQGIEDYFKVTK